MPFAAAEAKAVLGDRRRAGGVLEQRSALHAHRFALRLPPHAENGDD